MTDTETKTLCALQDEGFIQSNADEFRKLIQPANFFCKNCGRSAVRSENLCDPAELD